MRGHLLVGVLVLLSRGLLAAQEPPPASAHGTCFRGRPQSECDSFFLTEWSWVFRTAGVGSISPNVQAGNSYWTWQVGWMKNVSRHSAFGATFFLGAEQDRTGGSETIGVKARFRRWVGPKAAVEIGAGPTLEGSAIVHAALVYGDWVALEAQAEPGQKIFGERHLATYVGVRFGSVPGSVLGIAAPLTLLAVFLATYEAD